MEKNAGSWEKFSEVLCKTPPGNNGNIGKRYEQHQEKTNNVVFNQIRHKPSCTVTEDA